MREDIKVTGSRAEISPRASIPHISVTNKIRCLKWHPEGLESWSLSDWLTALVGEVGELASDIKNLNRLRDGIRGSRRTREELMANIPGEISDIYLYLDLLAQAAGFNLEDIIWQKFNEVSERNGFPERL